MLTAKPLDLFASRLTPARADLAADRLHGEVQAERFAPGQPKRVIVPLLDLTTTPDRSAERATQLLHGESFVAYEVRPDGLAWGQAELDGYVGYVDAAGLGRARGPGHRVTALWSHIYASPTARARVEAELPLHASLQVSGSTGAYYRLRDGGFVPRPHLAPVAGDHAAQAERFIGAPYLWGGRSARGLDCSALVQLSLLASGKTAPRDSDMQAALLGAPLPSGAALGRGDLIFWSGHVAIVRDADTLIHASGHQMSVVVEPIRTVLSRIGPATAQRRL